jgi:hypothetical protein
MPEANLSRLAREESGQAVKMGTNSFVHARKKLDNFFGKIHANLVLNYNESFFKYPNIC